LLQLLSGGNRFHYLRSILHFAPANMAGIVNALHISRSQPVCVSSGIAAPSSVSRRSRKVASKTCASAVAFKRSSFQIAAAKQTRCSRALRLSARAESTETVKDTFVPVLKLSELEKGQRALIETENNKSILFFWYRNEVYGIESRSPAEGAFSDGFKEARFTQDGCIECPSTKSTFSLATGEVKSWYPDNPVLRAITPQDTIRPLEVFPVKVTEDSILVDPYNTNVSSVNDDVAATPTTKGGSASSAERNNVFGIEPQMYLTTGEEIDMEQDTFGSTKLDPATLAISTVAVAIVAVAGTATCLYFESIPALAAFWIVGFSGVAYFIVQNSDDA